MSLLPDKCAPFDAAIHVKTFYYRAKSVPYRDTNGKTTRDIWGMGAKDKFAIWENDNFQYYDAQKRVLKSTLQEFSQGPESGDDDVSAKITFLPGGSLTEIPTK